MEHSNDNENKKQILKDTWAIRPCRFYKEEYDDCTSFKARFHQYFIFGEDQDCSQWLTDFKNCELYEKSNGNDVEAGAAVIKSEEHRRNERLKAHYDNTTWKKRTEPPEDWNKQLPEDFLKRSENSFLAIKQAELDAKTGKQNAERSYCSIM